MPNLVFGSALALLAVLLWMVLIPYAVTVPQGAASIYLAPDFWLRIIAGAMLAVGVLLAVSGWRQRKAAGADGSAAGVMEGEAGMWRYPRLGAGMMLFLAYYLAIEPLGLVLSSALALFAASLLYGERRYYVSVPLAIVLPVGLYFFFLKVALIPMPLGILDGIGPF